MKCAKCPARVALHILFLSVSPFFAINQVKEILLNLEQRLAPLIKNIINYTDSGDGSFFNESFGTFHD